MADITANQFSASAQSPNEPHETGGRVRTAFATLEADTNIASGDKLKLFKLPKDAVLRRFIIHHDDVGTTLTDVDFGDSNDVDGILDGVSFSGGAGSKDIDNDGGTNGFTPQDDYNKPLWELLGYSTRADAPALIEIEGSSNAASDGSGTISVVAEYVID